VGEDFKSCQLGCVPAVQKSTDMIGAKQIFVVCIERGRERRKDLLGNNWRKGQKRKKKRRK
jgi:hypothetical protein